MNITKHQTGAAGCHVVQRHRERMAPIAHENILGSPAAQARLLLLERILIPLPGYSVMNLFTDLLVNERLGRAGSVLRMHGRPVPDPKPDPAYVFCLAVHEERWQLEPGTLMAEARSSFDNLYPGYRADAQLMAQDVFHRGHHLSTRFLYFVSVLCRYLPLSDPEKAALPTGNDREPSVNDWANALTPDVHEIEAVERALTEGWLADHQARRLLGEEGLRRRICSLPGQDSDAAEQVPEIMAAYYRQQAAHYLDGHHVPLRQPRVEIYLDVSSSTPDPCTTRNAMTLAALILTTAALRAGGWARVLLYSHAHVRYWEWCRSEIDLSRFLMHYIGGGTAFPFDVLAESVAECGKRQPIRVVLSDADFDSNYDGDPQNAPILAEAARRSPQLVLLLHRPDPQRTARYHAVGARTVEVENRDDLPKTATDLTHVLFEEERRDDDHGLVS